MLRPFVWAHRGASHVAPENTLAAFSLALADGADGLELDVHLSRDGVPVVIHDQTVDRTTNGVGPVSALTLGELQALDAGAWFSAAYTGESIPTLKQVLALFAGCVQLNLEVKSVDAALATIDLLNSYPDADVVLSSFNLRLLRRLRTVTPQLAMAVLYEQGNRYRALHCAKEIAAVSFNPRVDLLSRPMLKSCCAFGLPVHTWTLDDPVQIRSLVRAGVSGVFTNNPACISAASALEFRSQKPQRLVV
ncbi:MAG: glycerophosphodiester phosphodiesterase family protein [Desulfuromonadales bacterium]|nr:glycerophosphodiester phosphodiesterase family protein [Desulfuromonadales bacterium]